jgi:hypothetical protein
MAERANRCVLSISWDVVSASAFSWPKCRAYKDFLLFNFLVEKDVVLLVNGKILPVQVIWARL